MIISFLAVLATDGKSQLVYSFHQEGSGDILAEMEFAELPIFDISTVLRLELFDPATPGFSQVLDLGNVGLFALIFEDDSNGLREGALNFKDFETDTGFVGPDDWVFNRADHLLFEISPDPFGDLINVATVGDGLFPVVSGDWVLVVPEPLYATMVPPTTLVLGVFRRRRKRSGEI